MHEKIPALWTFEVRRGSGMFVWSVLEYRRLLIPPWICGEQSSVEHLTCHAVCTNVDQVTLGHPQEAEYTSISCAFALIFVHV